MSTHAILSVEQRAELSFQEVYTDELQVMRSGRVKRASKQLLTMSASAW